MVNILLVEDSEELGKIVQTYLALQGHRVDREKDGIAGEATAKKMQYDCILLDVMLPGMDGFTVLSHVRKYSQTPIIMLTAKGEIDDKKVGFSGGADDYLVKPFDLEELHMRIQALLKRVDVKDTIIRKNIQFSLEENQVTKDGHIVHLTNTEFMILATLILAQGRTVSKSTLVETLWGSDGLREETNKLDVHVHNIRKKLDKDIIQTVAGVGYKSPL